MTEAQVWRQKVSDLRRRVALYGYDHKRTFEAIDSILDTLDGVADTHDEVGRCDAASPEAPQR